MYTYYDAVKKFFPELDDYREDESARTVNFIIRWGDVTYDDLAAISLIMETKIINFQSITETWGYCETCGGSETWTTIACSGVRFTETDSVSETSEIVKDVDISRQR